MSKACLCHLDNQNFVQKLVNVIHYHRAA